MMKFGLALSACLLALGPLSASATTTVNANMTALGADYRFSPDVPADTTFAAGTVGTPLGFLTLTAAPSAYIDFAGNFLASGSFSASVHVSAPTSSADNIGISAIFQPSGLAPLNHSAGYLEAAFSGTSVYGVYNAGAPTALNAIGGGVMSGTFTISRDATNAMLVTYTPDGGSLETVFSYAATGGSAGSAYSGAVNIQLFSTTVGGSSSYTGNFNTFTMTADSTTLPEPASLTLVAAGCGLAAVRRRRLRG